ncbi:MAG: alpha/beta fold hydrolase [Zoogloeaceae bacterium]|nr:alpha/beta fold hydrolase [Zoogloeaceae bacterium]
MDAGRRAAPSGRILRVLGVLAFVVLLAWGGALGAVYWRQESLLFHPAVMASDEPLARGRPGDAQWVEEVWIPVAGARLHALHLRHPNPRGLIFFLHGNSGNAASWMGNPEWYRRRNFDVFLLDYRGFGKSTGTISSEAQLHADVEAAWTLVAPGYAGHPIVVYGRSLGTGLAVRLAQEVSPALLVLVSPYASVKELARRDYPLVPDWVLKYPLSSESRIAAVRSPIFILHGVADGLIPIEHARRLATLAAGRAQLREIDGAGHGDIHRVPAYLDALALQLDQLPRAPTVSGR